MIILLVAILQVVRLAENRIHSLSGLSNHLFLWDIDLEENEVKFVYYQGIQIVTLFPLAL